MGAAARDDYSEARVSFVVPGDVDILLRGGMTQHIVLFSLQPPSHPSSSPSPGAWSPLDVLCEGAYSGVLNWCINMHHLSRLLICCWLLPASGLLHATFSSPRYDIACKDASENVFLPLNVSLL